MAKKVLNRYEKYSKYKYIHLDILKNIHKQIRDIVDNSSDFDNIQDFLAFCIFEYKERKGLDNYPRFRYMGRTAYLEKQTKEANKMKYIKHNVIVGDKTILVLLPENVEL